jgi:hypothetical protein
MKLGFEWNLLLAACALGWAAGGMTIGGCSGDECTPGKQTSCACPGEASGVQVCSDSGIFGTCDCSPTNNGGSPGSGGSGGSPAMGGSGGTPCTAPNMVCEGSCVDVMTSDEHCGTCGNPCPDNNTSCAGGDCVCMGNLSLCGGGCIDTTGDSDNCGGCDHSCLGAACSAGVCAAETLATTLQEVFALAIDATHAYYSQAGGGLGSVQRVQLDGSNVQALAPAQPEPRELAIDNGVLYWANFGFINDAAIGRYPIPNGPSNPLVSGLAAGPWAIAVLGDFVYFADQNDDSIWRKSISMVTAPQLIASGQARPWDIAVNATHVYWSNYDAGAIRRTPINGGQVPTFIASAQGNPVGVAIDTTHVYWANETGGQIKRAPLSGGNEEVLASGQTQPTYVAIDASHVYWTNFGAGTVQKAPLAGGAVTVLASGQNEPYHVAVDVSHVYWTTLGGGTVMRAPK